MDERDDDLRAQLDRLPREVPPARDLWPGIAQGIARSPRRRPARVAFAVSALALAAGLALAVGLRAWPRQSGSPVASASVEQASVPRPIEAVAPAPSLPGEAEYQGAERALSSELEARRATIPPAEVHVLDDSLRIFDDALDSTREALRAHPEDVELRAELDRVWEDKIDLLRQATEQPEGK
jgi:hypothetical protein